MGKLKKENEQLKLDVKSYMDRVKTLTETNDKLDIAINACIEKNDYLNMMIKKEKPTLNDVLTKIEAECRTCKDQEMKYIITDGRQINAVMIKVFSYIHDNYENLTKNDMSYFQVILEGEFL